MTLSFSLLQPKDFIRKAKFELVKRKEPEFCHLKAQAKTNTKTKQSPHPLWARVT
jgi:hypothetical protein